MNSPSPRSFLATTFGCVALLLTSCAPTQEPRETSSKPPPAAEISPAFDVQDVIRRVTRAFRSRDGAFVSEQPTI